MSVVLDTLSHMAKLDRMNNWVYKKVKPYVGRNVFEAGCGNGNLTSRLFDCELVVAVDDDEAMLDEARKRYAGKKNIRIEKRDLSVSSVGDLRALNIDTILCINTLEHIQDDLVVLRNFSAILNDGYLVLIVPAFMSLFSPLDEAAGHFRRYSKKEIAAKISACGFTLKECTYANFFGIFGWVLNGIILRRKRLSNHLLSLFDFLTPFFEFIEILIGPPVGLSIIAVCKKGGSG